jgi:hypothetical protein
MIGSGIFSAPYLSFLAPTAPRGAKAGIFLDFCKIPHQVRNDNTMESENTPLPND